MISSPHIRTLTMIGVAALALVALRPAPAAACKCAVTPLEERLRGSSHVFEAEITAIDKHEDSDPNYTRVVHVKVLRSFQGTTYASDELRTASSGAACGVYFEAGKRYLIFASLREEGGAAPELWTTSCAGTQPAELAEEDLKTLGEGSAPAANVNAEPAPAEPAASSAAPATQQAEPHGGCASCSVGAGRAAHAQRDGGALGLVLSTLALRRRVRARRIA